MKLTKQECRDLRKESSQLGQQNNTSIYDDYMPEEMTVQQAYQEGLSIITSPRTLNFHHTNAIYIKPKRWEDDEPYNQIY